MQEDNNVLLSVITIVKDDKVSLRATLESYGKFSLLFDGLEIIIVDGSKSPLLNSREKNKIPYCRYLHGFDEGIYDAMNIGLAHASGDYCWFMNAGDSFNPEPQQVQKLMYLTKVICADFIYGDSLEIVDDIVHKKRSRKPSLSFGLFTHHQAMIYRTDIIKRNHLKYDSSLNYAADFKFTAEYLQRINLTNVVYIKSALCIFQGGGVSQTRFFEAHREQMKCRMELYGSPIMSYAIFLGQCVYHRLRIHLPRFYWVLKR